MTGIFLNGPLDIREGIIDWNAPLTEEEKEEMEERIAVMEESNVKNADLLAKQIIIHKRLGISW